MNKRILILALGLLASSSVMADTKIGVLDYMKAVMETDAGKAANEKLNRELGEDKKRRDSLEVETREMAAAIKKDRLVLDKGELEKRVSLVNSKAQELQVLGDSLNRRMQQASYEFNQKMTPLAVKAVDEVRKEGGYQLLLEKAAVQAMDPALDVTGKVTAKLNTLVAGAPAAAAAAPAAAKKK